jgi:hypothetical protein
MANRGRLLAAGVSPRTVSASLGCQQAHPVVGFGKGAKG